MTARKTLTLRSVVAEANKFLLNSDQSETHGRKAVASFVEGLLHKANAYEGFRYLTWSELVHGSHLPGIIYAAGESGNHAYPDETRRQYHGGDDVAS